MTGIRSGHCLCGAVGGGAHFRTAPWHRMAAPAAVDDRYRAAGLPDDRPGLRPEHEIHIDRKPEADAFAGPTHQMTGAQFLAPVGASPEE